ncbi:MAG: outer membrane lipid asymmetry maintenance protein MlaD [Sphingobacteriia bacterium]|nr:outer membrane lipid asymmetry maintenance protein MlaD [Sphingobacteriia bacterium]
MNKSNFETLVGFLIIFFALFFLYFAYNKAEKVSSEESYTIIAKFDHIDGINTGSEIKIGGIKVGEVIDKQLDPNTYQAIVHFNIRKSVKIPSDSSAAITSDGLLGEKYVSIAPGAEDTMIKENGELKYTQSAVSLESLIGKMIFSKEDKKEEKGNTSEAKEEVK